MKAVFAFALFVLASALAEEKRQLVGICVEECSTMVTDSKLMAAMGIKQCPDGQVCMSNGCGHTCQPATSMTTMPPKTLCSGVMCAMFCFNGFELGPDGCPICRCRQDPIKATAVMLTPPSKCSDVMCFMFCDKGFLLGQDGCPICKCA